MSRKITRKEFLDFARYDDRLLQLEKRIKTHLHLRQLDNSDCTNASWHRSFKREITNLIGWNADDIRLQSSEAYDTVYSYLYNLFPDCNCDSLILNF